MGLRRRVIVVHVPPADRPAPRLQVALVDDDLWVRTGRATALGHAEGIDVVAALDHDEALRRAEMWSQVDVALVDAYDRRTEFDHFPGVEVVKAIRAHPSGSEVTIVVVTGHVANDLLRLRMAEAGADLFFGHDEVSDPGRLIETVLRARELSTAARPVGSGPIRPQTAMDWVRGHGYQAAFTGDSQKTLPFSRRTIMSMRHHIGSLMGAKGWGADPTWRQTSRFVNRARGADITDGDTDL